MKKRAASHTFLYGVNPVLEAVRGGTRAPTEILIAEGAADERLRKLIELARARNISIKRVPRALLNRTVGNTNHQGVIGRVAAAAYHDPEELLTAIGNRVGNGSEPLALVLDGIEDPRNLGAIVRTAECAGVAGIFIPERRAAGLNETVAKASAGALEYVPIARVTNVTRIIDQLKERNVWIVGTATDALLDYTEWDWQRASAVVVGSEGSGLHRLVREHCDALVRIPVHGEIDSLNVSVAAGIILYEALRQRAFKAKRLEH